MEQFNPMELQMQLAYWIQMLQEMRASNPQESLNTNQNSDNSSNKLPDYNQNINQQRESNYQSKISNLSYQLKSVTGQDQSNSAAAGGNFFDFLGTAITSGLESIGKAVQNGLGKAGEALGKAGDWFISQIKGPKNPNEDATALNGNCGPTCLAMILAKHGLVDTSDTNGLIDDVRKNMGGGEDEEGKKSWTNPSQIAQGAQQYGLDATSSSGKNVEDIEKALGDGKDVIALIRPNGPDSGHFVVVKGIEGNTVQLADPSKQEFTSISLEEFKQKFQGGFMTTIG